MKVVILAAGFGTRLSAIYPKPLTSLVDEKTILDFQIEKLLKHVNLRDIIIVVGYKKELVMERFPNLTYVYNENFARTGTGKSLLKAINVIDDDVIWLNGDVYFENEVLTLLLENKKSSILVNNKQCGDEEVKYATNSDGFISKISKRVKKPLGEALGINIITKEHLDAFRKELEHIEDNDYFERALELLIEHTEAQLVPVSIGDLFCQEIDFPEDLETVKKFIAKA